MSLICEGEELALPMFASASLEHRSFLYSDLMTYVVFNRSNFLSWPAFDKEGRWLILHVKENDISPRSEVTNSQD